MSSFKGDKQHFAIEYDITQSKPYLMGHFCLWIGGLQVGAYEDEVMLLSVKAALIRFKESLVKRQNLDFVEMDKEELFDLVFFNEDFDNCKYLIHVAESFDDFSLFAFTAGDEIHFVWQLREEPVFNYPDYPKSVIYKKVKISEFIEAVQDMESWQP